MTYDVVVLIEREMSEGDARRVAALHARRDEVVDYHLLISSHPTEGLGGPMASGLQFRRRGGAVGRHGLGPYDDSAGRSAVRSGLGDRTQLAEDFAG